MTKTIRLPFPPSLNTAWRSTPKGVLLAKSGRQYRENVFAAVLAEPDRPRFGSARVSISIDMHRGDRRKYDIDNYAKSVLDAIVEAGVIDDDEQVDELRLRRCDVEPGNGFVILTINRSER